MIFVLLGLLLVALLFGPQLWARWTLTRYNKHRDDFPGTGGQFARHLLDKLGMSHVKLETTDSGDHYDPQAKVVRLTEANFNGQSLTAVAVAAHEVGHAIQDYSGYKPLVWRGRLVVIAHKMERLGSGVMMVLPIVAAITRSPGASAAMFAVGILSMATMVFVHLVTLPVELDASFGRALPILKAGDYIDAKDQRAAKRILRACALTYVAASLASLLNFWRWLRLWRR